MNKDCEIDIMSNMLFKMAKDKNSATQLIFQDITFDSFPIIYPYLCNSGSRSCDYTAGGIYMWISYFKYQYCIVNDTLFIKGVAQDDRSTIAFSLPIGKMPLSNSIDLLAKYCTFNNIQLEFSAIPHEHIDEFRTFSHKEITPLDHWADYIYQASDLATLQGNKYNKKRNHVNRFAKDFPQARLVPIDANNIEMVRECFTQVCQIETTNKMANYERSQVWTILNSLHKLPFEARCLIIDNTVVAFTIGEIIGDTLHIHIEKTLHQYSGASESINKLFASQMLEKYNITYINREDDAGDPGLTKAKMTYHPTTLLKKYNVLF